MLLDYAARPGAKTDGDLVLACRRGDEWAWEEIVLRYQRLLFSIPRRAGLSSDQASDVLQEVFTTLFQKLDHLEKPDCLRAWLMTTAKHKTIHFIDRERRGGRHRYIDDDNDPVFEVIDGAALPDETLIALERDLEIEMALSRLKEPCLRLLTMLYLEDGEFSYADIAEELRIPLGSVGPTRARCLEKLMKLMPGAAPGVFSGRSK